MQLRMEIETVEVDIIIDEEPDSSTLHTSETPEDKNEKAIASLYDDEVEECCHEVRCNKRIPKEFALKHRIAFMEMTKEQQDLVILSQLQAFCTVPELASQYGDFLKRGSSMAKSDKKFQNVSKYHFCGLPVCFKMYFFLHDIGKTRFANLKKHFERSGIATRVHKLSNVKPAHKKALSTEDTTEVVEFIKGFAALHGLAVPSRTPDGKKCNIIKLPSNETKSSLHRRYLEAIKDRPDLQDVARSTFSQIWTKYCPHVVTTRPSEEYNIP